MDSREFGGRRSVEGEAGGAGGRGIGLGLLERLVWDPEVGRKALESRLDAAVDGRRGTKHEIQWFDIRSAQLRVYVLEHRYAYMLRRQSCAEGGRRRVPRSSTYATLAVSYVYRTSTCRVEREIHEKEY